MVTIGEQQVWGDMHSIARDLHRIANCMEAAEMRAREKEGPKPTTPEDIEQLGQAIKAIKTSYDEVLASLDAHDKEEARKAEILARRARLKEQAEGS